MIPQTNWLDRTFDFPFPAGVFACILERYRGTPARLRELVHHIPPDILTRRVDNAWSIQEHIGHLLDLCELDEKRLDEFIAGAATLTAADMQNTKTHQANHNARPPGAVLEDFTRVRSGLVARLEQLSEEQVSRTAIHPRLKKEIRLVDWLYFMCEHDDHHVARISGILRSMRRRA